MGFISLSYVNGISNQYSEIKFPDFLSALGQNLTSNLTVSYHIAFLPIEGAKINSQIHANLRNLRQHLVLQRYVLAWQQTLCRSKGSIIEENRPEQNVGDRYLNINIS